MKRSKTLKILIIILAILLGISVVALTGTLFYNYFVRTESTTVDVPGNIITSDDENSTNASDNDSTNDLKPSDSNPSLSGTTEVSSNGGTKASAISLHTKQPEENKSFQVTNMFPGDRETQYYRIKVSYKGDIIVRYHADICSGYEKLAEALRVKVCLLGSDELLYDGLMRDMPKSLNHALYTNEKKQSELYYEITAYLDTSVGNEYQDKELIADFSWWVEETENLDFPQTGDSSNIYLWIALVIGSFASMLILLAKRRKEAANEY